MENGTFFSYKWHIDDNEEEITAIRVYGINQKGENVCLRIDDFTPYIYIELPSDIVWSDAKAQLLGNKIDEIAKSLTPLTKRLIMKKKLYGSHMDKTGKTSKFPYLLCTFSSREDIKQLSYRIRKPVIVPGIGKINLKIHENNADPILQLTCCRDIPTAGWIQFKGTRIKSEHNKVTLCDHEFQVGYKCLKKYEKISKPAIPTVMGFDIEVNSSNPSTMPNPEKPGDKVFQAACIIAKANSKPSEYRKIILTLGNPLQKTTGKEVEIKNYKTEADLLQGFTDLVRSENINIIVGYNILCFDIPYMIDRAKYNMNIFNFDQMGFHKYNHAREKTIKWSSSAYKNQEFQYLDAEGRLFVDLLPLIQRSYKLDNFRLKTVSTHFLGETKDPLSVKGIFKCYRMGMVGGKKGDHAMGIVAKYCVQDAALCNRLMTHLHIWEDLTEMAKICNVQPFTLYTQGQQIKVFSQVYKFCMYKNIVVERDGYAVKDTDHYVGAQVFDPMSGYHKNVVPFDFESLYPTTIIAYNIDYSTWVTDENIPDSLCNVMEWWDHIGCEHDPKIIRKKELSDYIDTERSKIKILRDNRNSTKDNYLKLKIKSEIDERVDNLKPYISERGELNKCKPKHLMCIKRKYRWRKEPMGVIPTIIQNLLAARKKTRKGGEGSIADNKNKIDELEQKLSKLSGKKREQIETEIEEIQSTIAVLDKRQIAYKLSANSMYGGFGVRKGYIPFMPGAMCTTYMGRTNIEKVATTIPEKYGGKLIYGDTDSNYIVFPHLNNSQETWDYSEKVADEVTKLFPKPIQLEFEEEIYKDFFILTKKRYMYRKCLRDGVVNGKIGRKGVLLARRDNCKFIRDIYESTITKIFDHKSCEDICYFVLDMINQLCSGVLPVSDFTVTKSVGDSNNLEHCPFIDENGKNKWKVGDYKIPPLSTNIEERNEQLSKKNAKDVREYCLLSLPAQVQLAEKMRRRGRRVDNGSRLEYVITMYGGHTAKQGIKIECAEYFTKHKRILNIDYMYYLKLLSNPMDQLLNVAFKNDTKFKPDMVLSQYKYRLKIRENNIKQLKTMFDGGLVLVD